MPIDSNMYGGLYSGMYSGMPQQQSQQDNSQQTYLGQPQKQSLLDGFIQSRINQYAQANPDSGVKAFQVNGQGAGQQYDQQGGLMQYLHMLMKMAV